MNQKVIARYCVRELMGVAIIGVALFWTAGTINWLPAWAVIVVTAAWSASIFIVIMKTNPDLLAERLGPHKGAKRWDTVIMGIVGVAQLARFIVAGLDKRNGWTDGLPTAVPVIALILCILGYALVTWATASNAFFSQIVRLQPERSHTVATGGPYRRVRHPAYSGGILFDLAVPFLLGSWWALIPSGLSALLFVIRTALEDRTLLTELEGYSDYAHTVRYRLVPRLW